MGFHITEWEDFCLEAAQTRYKYEQEQTETSDEYSLSGETVLVTWEERVGLYVRVGQWWVEMDLVEQETFLLRY